MKSKPKPIPYSELKKLIEKDALIKALVEDPLRQKIVNISVRQKKDKLKDK